MPRSPIEFGEQGPECPHLSEEILADYVAGRTGERTDAEVEAHVSNCPVCASALEEAARFELLFEQAAAGFEPAPMENEREQIVVTRLEPARADGGQRGHWSQSLSTWAVAASVATLTFATQFSGGSWMGSGMRSAASMHTQELRGRGHGGLSPGLDDDFPACGSPFSLGALAEYPACELPWSLAELGGDEQSLVAHALGLRDPAFDLSLRGDEVPEFCSWDDVPRSFPGEPVCLWPSSSG